MHRRGVVAARAITGLALTGLLITGCSATEPEPNAVDWLIAQESVADAEWMPYDDEGEGAYVLITLERGISDEKVGEVVNAATEHFDDDLDPPGLEVDVDGFRASVFPGVVSSGGGISDHELLRALWLRADGRAISYGDAYHSTVSTHPTVIAPAETVAQLALDYDAAVSHEDEVRYSMSVESVDGTTGVQWTSSLPLGFAIDEDAVGEFSRLQEAHPGTTGWVDCTGTECRAAVYFSDDDVSLDQVRNGDLLDASLYSRLDLGWGPARADSTSFADDFADPVTRDVLSEVMPIDGVTGFFSTDVGLGRGIAVTVDSAESFGRVLEYSAGGGPAASIRLQRHPVLFGPEPDPVFTADRDDPAEWLTLYSAIADLSGIRRVLLGKRNGTVSVDEDVTDAELTTLFSGLLTLPYEYIDVHAVVSTSYGSEGDIVLGRADGAGFHADDTSGAGYAGKTYPDLVARVADAWEEAIG